MFGYAGQILRIDLSSRKIEKEELGPEIASKFIGGMGIGAKLLYDAVKPNTDALSPGNALVASAGPLSGTVLIGANKTSWASKSPLTGLVQIVPSGDFGTNLKWAGYDAMVITGKADKPVYITIFDDEVRINDADKLWGKDVYEATDELWDKYGDNCTIFCIGPAGEKLGRISMAFTNKISTGGRKGSGAVPGSKNLKAIVVRGTKGLRVAHTKELLEKADELYNRYRQDPLLKEWMEMGLAISLEAFSKTGFVAWKNWREAYPADRYLSRFNVKEFMKIRDVSIPCIGCPLGCKILYHLRAGEYAGLESPTGNPVGAVITFSGRYDLTDYNQVIKCHDTANRLGLDGTEASFVLDFLMDLQERGIIDEKVTDGMKLERNLNTILTWLPKIANREGFGDAIADGYPGVFNALGQEIARDAIQRKGSSPAGDARSGSLGNVGAIVGLAGPHNSLVVGPGGGRNLDSLRRYYLRTGMSEETFDRLFSNPSGVNAARLTRYSERWGCVLNCMGICNRTPLVKLYDLPLVTELYYLVTGNHLEPSEILMAADRCVNLLKLFNIRQGATRNDDYLPERFFTEPLYLGGKENWLHDDTKRLSKEDVEMLLDDYYDERGWDKDGVPTRKTLEELGLAEYAILA